MNIRLSILLVTILVLFAGTYFVIQINDSNTVGEKQPWLYKIDDKSIVALEVTHDNQTVIYAKKKGSSKWSIKSEDGDIPVAIAKWSGTTLVLSGPQVNRVLEGNIGQMSEYGLDPPQTVVKITERSGLIQEFHIGYQTPDGENQYAILSDDPQLFTVPQVWALVINKLATNPPYLTEEVDQPES